MCPTEGESRIGFLAPAPPCPAPPTASLRRPMQAVSQPGVAIDLEDFRRLGVRPQETRVPVIRMAATRSARWLAKAHLLTPNPDTEIQLSRVATSAYRLMDPRQRLDETARVRVGRILPLTLHWAGRTRFADSSIRHSLESAFHQESLSDLELTEMLELDGSDCFTDEVQGWTPDGWEDSQSFARSTPSLSTPSSLATRSKSRRTILIIASIAASFLFMFFGFRLATLNQSDSTSAPQDSTDIALRSDWETEGFETQPMMLVSALSIDDWAMMDRESLLLPEFFDLVPIVPLERLIEEASTEVAQAVASQRLTRPDRAQLRKARREMLGLVPELQQFTSPNQVAALIRTLERTSEETQPGSPLHWVCYFSMAELEWLSESSTTVAQRLERVAELYGEPSEVLLAETFEAACRRAGLPETHRHLLDVGMPLADQLLIDESFAESRRIVQALRQSADSLEAPQTITQLQTLFEAIAEAERMSVAIQRVEVDPVESETDASARVSTVVQRGVHGRYLCLYLRQWKDGLPWLTDAADSRLAGAARRELELDPSSDPDDVMKVAMLWLSLADRLQGRVADSVRLHGLEVLESLLPQTSGLERLKLQRRIEEEATEVPSYLRRPMATG